MKKIEFVNGTTIDGAQTFNDMQNNVEDVFNGEEAMGSIVVEDVRSKNLFDINTMVEGINSYRNFQDGILVAIAQFNSLKIPVNPNETYSFSTDATAHSNLCFFDSSMNYISGLVFDNQNTLTTPNNCYYITMAVKNDYTWCQLEKGDKATPYTPYKEFSNKHIYSTEEHIVGTWKDGRDIYERTIEFTTTTSPEIYRHNIPNIDKVVDWEGHVTRSANNASFPLNQYNPVYPGYYNSLDSINTEQVEVFAGDNVKNGLIWTITMRYLKNTQSASTMSLRPDTTEVEETE